MKSYSRSDFFSKEEIEVQDGATYQDTKNAIVGVPEWVRKIIPLDCLADRFDAMIRMEGRIPPDVLVERAEQMAKIEGESS